MFPLWIPELFLNTIIFSSLVLVATLVLSFLLRRSAPAKFSCCFCGLVLSALAPCLIWVGSATESRQFRVALPYRSLPQATLLSQPAPDSVTDDEPNDSADSDGSTAVAEATIDEGDTAATYTRVFSFESLWVWGAWIWLAVSSALLIKLFRSIVGVHRLVTRRQQLDGDALGFLPSDLVGRLNDNGIQLGICDGLRSPVAAYWPVKAILLPKQFIEENSTGTVARVLEHERAHVLRRDQLTLLIETLISCFFWFHPLVYWVRRRLDQAREDICDNWVLERSKSSDYCRDLVLIGEKLSAQTGVPVGLPSFVSSRKIASRVRSLLNPSRQKGTTMTSRNQYLLGVFLSLAGSLTLLSGFDLVWQDEDSGNSPEFLERLGAAAQQFKQPHELAATVLDNETGKPISGASVRLLTVNFSHGIQEVAAKSVTDEEGSFELKNLDQTEDFPNRNFVVVVQKEGKATQVIGIANSADYLLHPDQWKIKMGRNAVLAGRVLEPDGTPVVGAWVYQPMFLSQPIEGVRSARTDEGGWFKVLDHSPYQRPAPRNIGPGVTEQVSGTLMMVSHPDYGRKYFNVTKIPDRVKVEMIRGFFVEGRAVNKETGEPIAGLTVHASGHNHRSFENTRTDANGNFKLTLMPGGVADADPLFDFENSSSYNIWVRHPELEAAAQTAAGDSGQKVTLSDFELEPLVSVTGIVIDDETGEPFQSDGHYSINWYGDTRPKSTSECKSARVNPDGTFELKVLPGTIFPYVGHAVMVDINRSKYKSGVKVGRDQKVELEFRVQIDESRNGLGN